MRYLLWFAGGIAGGWIASEVFVTVYSGRYKRLFHFTSRSAR